ncbi:hypothetical protein GPJ56_000999 [Histomonas meleagridis]|uniref:uncharacterized protein n=1 Tax=Histomonas meleagridis TaxID=135588 RepID=UPI003559500F|nr:hypothetical protein GPJ56_000999 [Histomonas meleagridis]KAH0803836.1 hypothetical protein GO595_002666 [Histomonas meleagridis]
MLCLFATFIASKKIEAIFDIKFTASCPLSPEAYMIVDKGEQIIKPTRKGKTYVRLHPGKHTIDISHPWCKFYPVEFNGAQDGSFKAITNSTAISKYPITVRHMPLEDDDPLSMMLKNKWMLLAPLILIGFQFLKRYMSKPEVMAKVQEMQENLRRQQEEMTAQANRARTN